MHWWQRNTLRLWQNNIRETDGNLDVDRLVENLKSFHVNTLMLNTGGIVAFYPTALEGQYRCAGQTKDLIGEAVEKCHANGIRFVARFDFSKVDDSVWQRHPDWCYRSADGRSIHYNGTAATCPNGHYQRQVALDILSEVMDRYPIDGVFFNMFGYQSRDYSGNVYGPCHCEGCRNRFRALYGHDLPTAENPADPVWQEYLAFQRLTVRELLEGIHGHVKGRNPEIAISTYDEYCVDIVRKESNTELNRPLPRWAYSASENVQSLEDSWADKLVSNCCINAVGLDVRFMGVGEHEVTARLYENIAAGSGLDFCIIGNFDDYPDPANYDGVRRVFAFHAANERYFGALASVAQVGLVKPDRRAGAAQRDEYHGLFRMLKEGHIPFDVLHQENLPAALQGRQYKAILLPDVRGLDAAGEGALLTAQAGGTALVATGRAGTEGADPDFARKAFGIAGRQAVEDVRSSYLHVDDRTAFPSFPCAKWVFLAGEFDALTGEAGTVGLLPHQSAGRYGPPERCGGHTPTGLFGAMHRPGPAEGWTIPWGPGRLYLRHGYAEHRDIVLDILRSLLPAPVLASDAPSQVELFLHRVEDGLLLQAINLTGFDGTAWHAPLPVGPFTVRVGLPVAAGRALTDGRAVVVASDGDGAVVTIDHLGSYEAIVLTDDGQR